MKRARTKFHSLLHSADILEKMLATLLSTVGVRPRQARILNTVKQMRRHLRSSLQQGLA